MSLVQGTGTVCKPRPPLHTMEQCRCRHLSTGIYVTINVRSRPELNALVWKVVEHGQGDRIIVQNTTPDACVPEGHKISVRCNAVSPLAVVPYVPGISADPNTTSVEPDVRQLEDFIGASSHNGRPRTGVWLPLPLLCGNAIMLVDTPPMHGQALVMYPRLAQYTVLFKSAWNGDIILMMECDVLKTCPACQVWPWCAWCGKFLLPVMAHRCSNRHTSFRKQLFDKGPTQMRLETLEYLRKKYRA